MVHSFLAPSFFLVREFLTVRKSANFCCSQKVVAAALSPKPTAIPILNKISIKLDYFSRNLRFIYTHFLQVEIMHPGKGRGWITRKNLFLFIIISRMISGLLSTFKIAIFFVHKLVLTA